MLYQLKSVSINGQKTSISEILILETKEIDQWIIFLHASKSNPRFKVSSNKLELTFNREGINTIQLIFDVIDEGLVKSKSNKEDLSQFIENQTSSLLLES